MNIPPDQYYLSRHTAVDVGEGYYQYSINGWNISIDSNYNIHPVKLDNEQIGVVMGTIIDPSGVINKGSISIEDDTKSVPAAFEDVLSELAGRFVALLITTEHSSFYVDACGMLPAVFDKETKTIASSQAALPDFEGRQRFKTDLFDQTEDLSNIWLPGGVTYHRSVRRVLPNH